MFRQWVPSPVEVTAPARAVGLRPELAFQLHQAPDLGAVRATIGLDAFGEFVDGGQVDASSSGHRSSGAAIGWPRSGSCQVPTGPAYRTQVREWIGNAV
jgi:hypothetical protein